MIWQAKAPSNIALIKYMGRKDNTRLPVNPSLSYTLDNLISIVELEYCADKAKTHDTWEVLNRDSFVPVLSQMEQQRFLNHLGFLKKQFNFTGCFIVRSSNNFPAACGLASSASSFAALTLCTIKALRDICPENCPKNLSQETMANWSRQASGSSCRSFFGPWVVWEGKMVNAVELPYPELIHHVILINKQKKIISSSEAHARVLTSPLFTGRAQRAAHRLDQLLKYMRQKNWPSMYHIIWEEFLDMHGLFETASQPFSYREPKTQQVLDYLQNYWVTHKDGPLVTMDAGPNIHLLFRPDQIAITQELVHTCQAIL